MKKIIIFTLFLVGTGSNFIQSSNNYETVWSLVFKALYDDYIGKVIHNSLKGVHNRGTETFLRLTTGFLGIGMTCIGSCYLIKEFKQLFTLWKKFENKEKVEIEWRKIPRKVICGLIIAFSASVCGFTFAYVGFTPRGLFQMYHFIS